MSSLSHPTVTPPCTAFGHVAPRRPRRDPGDAFCPVTSGGYIPCWWGECWCRLFRAEPLPPYGCGCGRWWGVVADRHRAGRPSSQASVPRHEQPGVVHFFRATGFGQSGSLEELYRHHGLDADTLVRDTLDLVEKANQPSCLGSRASTRCACRARKMALTYSTRCISVPRSVVGAVGRAASKTAVLFIGGTVRVTVPMRRPQVPVAGLHSGEGYTSLPLHTRGSARGPRRWPQPCRRYRT